MEKKHENPMLFCYDMLYTCFSLEELKLFFAMLDFTEGNLRGAAVEG